MHASSRTLQREIYVRQQGADARADRVPSAPFISESDTDRSRKIGARPGFTCDVEHERRVDRLSDANHPIDANRAIGERAAGRGYVNAVSARTSRDGSTRGVRELTRLGLPLRRRLRVEVAAR